MLLEFMMSSFRETPIFSQVATESFWFDLLSSVSAYVSKLNSLALPWCSRDDDKGGKFKSKLRVERNKQVIM